MKNTIFAIVATIVLPSLAYSGDPQLEDLMRRMGFSQKEIEEQEKSGTSLKTPESARETAMEQIARDKALANKTPSIQRQFATPRSQKRGYLTAKEARDYRGQMDKLPASVRARAEREDRQNAEELRRQLRWDLATNASRSRIEADLLMAGEGPKANEIRSRVQRDLDTNASRSRIEVDAQP